MSAMAAAVASGRAMRCARPADFSLDLTLAAPRPPWCCAAVGHDAAVHRRSGRGARSHWAPHWDGLRRQFRRLLRACRDDRTVPVRSGGPARDRARLALPECTRRRVARLSARGARRACSTAIAPMGPYQPEHGHRFNPNKLLLDPYARRTVPANCAGPMRCSAIASARRARDLSLRPARQRAGDAESRRRRRHLSLGRRPAARHALGRHGHLRSAYPWPDQAASDGPEPHERGTFAAPRRPRVIEHLRRLGVTAIELLPIHAFLQDRVSARAAPAQLLGLQHAGLLRAGAALSVRTARRTRCATAVRRLHAAGIEVILDVVYNHTCEGSELRTDLVLARPRQCQLLPAAPVRTAPSGQRYRAPATRINISHPRVLQMVHGQSALLGDESSTSTDSASISASRWAASRAGSIRAAGFFDAIMQDPVLSRLKLISEPWDIGPGGYQLGNHPARLRRMERPVFATACAGSGAAIPGCAPSWPRGCRAPATCST